MGDVIKLPPVYFDIRHAWKYDFPKLSKNEELVEAVARLFARWVDIAEFKREETCEADPEAAEEEFEKDILSARDNFLDWQWLVSQFEAFDLYDVQYELCRALLPEHEWEIVESNEHIVVANKDRTLVADMVLCDRIPAAASLLYAGDESFASDPSITRELIEFIGGKVAQMEWSIAKAKEHLEQAKEMGEFHILRPVEDE